MNRTLLRLSLGTSLALLALPSDGFAGRGGGRGGGYGGGYGGSRGGYGGESRGGYGGEGRDGGMGGSPSFSQPRQSSSQSRPEGGSGYGEGASSGNRAQSSNPFESGSRSQSGNAGAAAAGANRNQNQSPSNADAAAAGAKRNQNQSPSNAGAAAAGAGYANRNQGPSNAGAAAAGAGYANRNQPNVSNAGAAAAGAGYANRNQPNISNAGAAAVGAGYANRNQPNISNAGAAAVGAGYANNNRYNQYHPGVVNGYWGGNNSSAWGASGSALMASPGVGAWGAGSPVYSYGYSGYSNPYSATAGGAQAIGQPQQAAMPANNYSQPISTTSATPEQPTIDQANAAFDQARAAFTAGDYANAQQVLQPALAQLPNDTAIHEFFALVLFAQGKYEQAAAPLYAVLSVGPGWNWTTLSGMYPDVGTYTAQLRTLESYVGANPGSAAGHFVLAYQYLCDGHDTNAVAQLKQVVKLMPGDTLSAQLLAKLQPEAAPAPSAPTIATPPVAAGTLPGRWTARDANITLAIQNNGQFSWTTSGPGKPPATIAGTTTLADGVLTLADQGGQNGALAGRLVWQDPDHFNFRLVGAPSTDPGLNFSR